MAVVAAGELDDAVALREAARKPDTVYQPLSQVSPNSYGRLNGAFGRPNTYYDGYPGVYYDTDGRYYGYAGYGNLGMYYGYRARGGPVGVGAATARSMVANLILVHIIGSLYSVIFFGGNPRLPFGG